MTTEADDDNDNQEEAATSQLPSTTAADVESSTNSTTKQQEQQADGTETKPESASDIVDDELAQAVGKIHVTDDKVEPEEMPEALRKVASWIMDGTVKNILVLTGAGVSVSAGIPDFRTPGTGLYDNLQKYDLPYPEAVFDVDFYRDNPDPFCSLAAEIWPGVNPKHTPTLTHSFVGLLGDRGLLLRDYSQNIDGLEYLADIAADKLVECHGHFRTASCIQCGKTADAAAVKKTIVQHGQAPVCIRCHSYVKPDIVFFGEGLPKKFHNSLRADLEEADMVLILGTSLQVAPVSMIPDMVSDKCKRVLLNRELVGDLDLEDSDRDVFYAGDCDDTILKLAVLLDWQEDLQEWNARVQGANNAGSDTAHR